jgi:hypothetical protein
MLGEPPFATALSPVLIHLFAGQGMTNKGLQAFNNVESPRDPSKRAMKAKLHVYQAKLHVYHYIIDRQSCFPLRFETEMHAVHFHRNIA